MQYALRVLHFSAFHYYSSSCVCTRYNEQKSLWTVPFVLNALAHVRCRVQILPLSSLAFPSLKLRMWLVFSQSFYVICGFCAEVATDATETLECQVQKDVEVIFHGWYFYPSDSSERRMLTIDGDRYVLYYYTCSRLNPYTNVSHNEYLTVKDNAQSKNITV